MVPIEKYDREVINFINRFDEYYSESKPKEKFIYKFLHDKQKDIWVIEKNGTQLKVIPYSRSKGMKYVVYLSKYYRARTILDSDLRQVIDNWHRKSKKTAEVSTDAKKILQDLIYLFEKQCPELAPLNDCVVISSKESGCHFRALDNISLEISDEDIPDPIY